MADDFGSLGAGMASKKFKGEDKGEPRSYLKVWENLPAQFLNVYGQASYTTKSDATIWKHVNEPLASGAKYMTEWCDADEERRGVATNRWILAVLCWCKYQQNPQTKIQNEAIIEKKKCQELYVEIAAMEEFQLGILNRHAKAIEEPDEVVTEALSADFEAKK